MATQDSTYRIETTQVPAGQIVRIRGSLDVARVDELEQQFTVLADLSPKLIVIDLSGVEMLSSIAMGAVLRLHQRLRNSGGRVALAAVPPSILAALRRARIDLLVPVHPTIDAALASSGSSGAKDA